MYCEDKKCLGKAGQFRAKAESFKPSKQYRLIEDISTLTMTNLSDRYWAENVGTRTPIASIGSYWDESNASAQDLDLGDLLDQ